ncbi:MAG: DUF4139 domain-containing protein [Treponema sp.]|jgi:hypothetical protein|nr:DUF4139 domain-containing protein [Treponema sp.]
MKKLNLGRKLLKTSTFGGLHLIYPLLEILLLLNRGGVFAQSIQDRGDGGSGGQAGTETSIPLRKISLFSSGTAYFEHRGDVSGDQVVRLPFNRDAVNDVLKSLVINDPGSVSPSVRYASEQTLYRTLRSLRIDLSENPGAADILQNLRGAEIRANTPAAVTGRILGVEYRYSRQSSPSGAEAQAEGGNYNRGPGREAWLSLATDQGIRVMAVKDIISFSFTDPQINGDLKRALDLLLTSRDEETRLLTLSLPGAGQRGVSLSYVIPAPVWKVSYRLDLSREQSQTTGSLFQGWAIVDNDGDTDWIDVELSLVTGRPVSFVQNLYPPYYLYRPTLPLAIAGIAEAETYDSGWGRHNDVMEEAMVMESREYEPRAKLPRAAPAPASSSADNTLRQSLAGGTIQTALGQALGDQFEFTFPRRITLERRQSAMFPLVEGTLDVEKTLVFSGARAADGGLIHPAIAAEITNTMGMKLPAGPITVFDGGSYAGDALIEFLPPGEKRLISYGADLSVTGAMISSVSQSLRGVTISGGVMSITRRNIYEKTYTFNNALGERKRLILEHPITGGTELTMPADFDERTDSVYRFSMTLPAERELTITVREESPREERIILAQLRPETFAAYASTREIPANIRAALLRAIELKKAAEDARAAQAEIEEQRNYRISEQDRIRRNLEAVGSQTPQGQEYLKRLVTMDGEIDALSAVADTARKDAQDAQKSYEDYLGELNL